MKIDNFTTEELKRLTGLKMFTSVEIKNTRYSLVFYNSEVQRNEIDRGLIQHLQENGMIKELQKYYKDFEKFGIVETYKIIYIQDDSIVSQNIINHSGYFEIEQPKYL